MSDPREKTADRQPLAIHWIWLGAALGILKVPKNSDYNEAGDVLSVFAEKKRGFAILWAQQAKEQSPTLVSHIAQGIADAGRDKTAAALARLASEAARELERECPKGWPEKSAGAWLPGSLVSGSKSNRRLWGDSAKSEEWSMDTQLALRLAFSENKPGGPGSDLLAAALEEGGLTPEGLALAEKAMLGDALETPEAEKTGPGARVGKAKKA